MKFVVAAFVVLACTLLGAAAELPRSAPEAQGVSSAELLAFVEVADQELDSLHSVMIVRHGNVVAEGWWAPYGPQVRHSLYSLSKSFTSTAVGLAIAEGKLNLDDEVLKFFPELAPAEPSDHLKKMRVCDLLRMATGHQTEPPITAEVPWAKSFLHHPVLFKPGTHFQYNTPATYMQSAIVQKVTGTTLLEYLKPRLFDPLGIENPTWESSPQGISAGGWGLSVRTEDIARFGQLYLQQGKWDGKQLIPASWVEAATARQTSNGSNPASDWEQGYGYQFWRCRHNGYRGDGAFGQYCIVLPEQDAVIAITSGLRDMQQVLDKVWDKLLPAMKATPLPANGEAHSNLQRRLKGLALRPLDGSPANLAVASAIGRKFIFPPNEHQLEAIRLESLPGEQANEKATGQIVWFRIGGVEHRVECRRGEWFKSSTNWGLWNQRGWGPMREQLIATSGAWTSPNAYDAKVRFYETPFTIGLNLQFQGDEVCLHIKPALSFDPKFEIQLTGIAGETTVSTSKVESSTEKSSTPATTATSNNASKTAAATASTRDFSKWEKEISAFEEADKMNPPTKGGVLFIGSSVIRLWKTLADDFPDHQVTNRGFGGSHIVDSTHFAERIVFPYEPRQIILRAGGNDIHAGKLPAEVAQDFVDFVRKVHSRLPNTEIYYVAVNATPARWGENDKCKALNATIRERAVNMPRVGFIDTYDLALDQNGKGRRELFVEDMLHLNADGYKLLVERVRPFLHQVPPKK